MMKRSVLFGTALLLAAVHLVPAGALTIRLGGDDDDRRDGNYHRDNRYDRRRDRRPNPRHRDKHRRDNNSRGWENLLQKDDKPQPPPPPKPRR